MANESIFSLCSSLLLVLSHPFSFDEMRFRRLMQSLWKCQYGMKNNKICSFSIVFILAWSITTRTVVGYRCFCSVWKVFRSSVESNRIESNQIDINLLGENSMNSGKFSLNGHCSNSRVYNAVHSAQGTHLWNTSRCLTIPFFLWTFDCEYPHVNW